MGTARSVFHCVIAPGPLNADFEIECLRSLHFPNMDQREYIVENAATKTCTWLLGHEKYTAWLAQRHTLLWIVGKPGAGKSTLIRYALRNSSFENDVVASFFFYGRGSDLQKSACGMFRSLSHQLSDQTPELLSKLNLIFRKKCETKQKSEPHETELRELLQDWILSASRDRAIRIYLDALDEAGQEVAVKLVAYFEELIERLHPTSPGLRVCFSCRHYPVLSPKNALKVCVEEENHHDIETYVRQRMTRHQLSDQEKSRKLEQEIIEKSSCIFQWVVLIIPIIIQSDNDGASVAKIRQKIKEIPSKLSDLYQHILSSVRDPKRAVQLMQWICFARRPLSLEELRYAMVVDITKDFRSLKECQSSVDFADTDEQIRRTVNSLSGGLAEVVEYEDRQTVRFIHQSVNDYLIESGLRSFGSFFFQDVNDYLTRREVPTLERSLSDNVVGLGHFRISRSCVKYMKLKGVLEEIKETIAHANKRWTKSHFAKGPRRLNYEGFEYQKMPKEQLNRRFPFLRYCANWASHAEVVEKQRMPQADLIPLFRWPSEDFIQSWAAIFSSYLASQDGQHGTLSHFASQHGLSSVIEAMIESGANLSLDTKDEHGCTPLFLAAKSGHEAVVSLLIERDDVDINSKGENAWTPLWGAARNGHEEVVRLLIERGVEINSRDSWGQTPLSWAASRGHEAVVRLLIERGAEIDSRDRYVMTPFSHAVCWGHEAVAGTLIELGAGIDSKNDRGRTPLSEAANNGHEAVVRLLVERGAEVNSRDDCGETPLSRAAGLGQNAAGGLLIELGAEIDSRDNKGRTPLSLAAGCMRQEMVSLLIKQDNVDVESKDDEGLTPIDHARKRGSEGKSVVKLLENEISRRKNQLEG